MAGYSYHAPMGFSPYIRTTDFLRPDGSKRAELERTDYTDKAGAWFTLDGRKLDGKPTKAGLYIHGGRKVVVK